jgi:hypothetical protein
MEQVLPLCGCKVIMRKSAADLIPQASFPLPAEKILKIYDIAGLVFFLAYLALLLLPHAVASLCCHCPLPELPHVATFLSSESTDPRMVKKWQLFNADITPEIGLVRGNMSSRLVASRADRRSSLPRPMLIVFDHY